MFKLFLTIIFSTLSIACALGQGVEQTLALGHRMYGMQQYERASRYFKRVTFFGNDSIRTITYPLLASCYLKTGNYSQSLFYYQLALNTTKSDSLYNEYVFSRALCNILMHDYDLALREIYSFNDYGSAYFQRKYHFYLGVVFLKKNDPVRSQHHFTYASRNSDEFSMITKAFNAAELNSPNPLTAKVLSIFVPGLGQLYAGDPSDAANSFLLNAGLGTLLIAVALNQTFLDGLLTVGPWLQRYHAGGYNKAERIAIIKREQKRDQLLNSIYTIFYEGNSNPIH